MIIEYKDLFDPNIPDKIQGLIESIKSVGTAMDEMVADVQSKSKLLSDSLSGTSSSTRGGRDTTQAQAAQAEVLYNTYNQLKEATKYLADNLVVLSKAQQDNKKIVDALVVSDDKFADVLSRLKAEAELAAAAIGKLGGNADSAAIRELTARVNALQGQVKSLEGALKSQGSAMANVTKSTNSQSASLLSLEESYRTLSGLIEQTGVSLDKLSLSDKAVQQISKNGEIANKSLEGSYNQLYAQYNLIKTALNAMGREMREDTKIGKIWEAQALDLMNQMKAMQEATGKNTLSVGDYGKALNGLNISTMQILREMPTLANSLSQFFIAISNNVPIFVDNFKRAQDTLGGFTGALTATLKSLFSWQTLLLGVLTIIPGVIRGINAKKKAQEEDNKATAEAAEKTKTLADRLRDMEIASQQAIIEINFLTRAIGDQDKTLDERLAAGERIKELIGEEIESYTAEQIALGNASTAIENFTKRLYEQAKARASLNQMSELTAQYLELEDKSKLYADWREGGKTIQEWYDIVTKAAEEGKSIRIPAMAQEYVDTYRRMLGEMKGISNQIAIIEKQISPAALLDPHNGGKEVKESLDEIPSYYYDMLQSIIDLMDEGLAKELAQYDLSFRIQKQNRQKQLVELEDMLKTANEDERAIITQQMEWLSITISKEEENYYKTRERMIREHLKAYEDVVAEEPDYEQEEIKRIKTIVDVDKRLRDQMAYNRYEQGLIALQNDEKNAKSEAELKNDLNNELLASQRKYWEDYLKMLKDSGALTVEEYNRIMQNISNLNTTPSTRRRRGRASYRNIVEAALSFSSFGEKVTDENGNTIHKIKDEYVDFVAAINNGLQTSINYMNEWMDKRIEMAELAIDKAKEEADAAKSALDIEQQARANGYANNVELARKEYEEKKQLELEAIAEKKRLQKIEQAIDTATQISSLVTATANIWAAYSKLTFVGHILAAAVTAMMWTSFAAAKVKAAQVTKAETHGEGMAEYLNYGGSHASGHDIDFGRTKDGRPRRVEKGEIVGVIKKRSVQKYGVERVLNFINSLNNGTFGETAENRANLAFLQSRLTDIGFGAESASMGLKMPFTDNSDSLRANYSAAFEGLKGVTDLSVLERGVGELVKQGELRVVQTSAGRIEYRGNNKRIIRNG